MTLIESMRHLLSVTERAKFFHIAPLKHSYLWIKILEKLGLGSYSDDAIVINAYGASPKFLEELENFLRIVFQVQTLEVPEMPWKKVFLVSPIGGKDPDDEILIAVSWFENEPD